MLLSIVSCINVRKERYEKIYPLIITDKVQEAAQFDKDKFDFVAVVEEDWYVQLRHKDSGLEIAFMIKNAASQPKAHHTGFNGHGLIVSLEVDDAAADWKHLGEGKDLEVIVPLKDEALGQRHFIIADPAGVHIDVVQQQAVTD